MAADLAEDIVALQRGERAELSDGAEPAEIGAGLAVQLEVLDRWRSAGETLAGWKVGFSAGAGREMVAPGYRPFGFVLESRVFQSAAELDLAPIVNCALEPEIGVVLGSPLAGPSVTVEDARRAVRALVPAFEINAVRLPGRSLPMLAADGFAQWGIVLGAEVDPASVDLATTAVAVTRDDEPVTEVRAEGFLDDPYLSLTRLCASLDEFGLGLAAGDRVITGGLSNDPVSGPGRWRAEFNTIGTVEVTFLDHRTSVDERGDTR
jgi:2-keto-4-pentenoate hydratase